MAVTLLRTAVRLCYCKPDSSSTMCVSRRGRDGMITADSVDASSRAWSAQLEILLILLQQLRETEKQEGCVENSAAPVEMPTDTPFVFSPRSGSSQHTSFRFSHIADCSLCLIPGITNALRQVKENNDAQPNEEPRNTDPTRLPRHKQQRNKVRPSR